MTKEDAISKIKDQLKKLMTFSEEVEKDGEDKKFTSMKLKDGSEISILDGTELGVGTEVFIVDEEGNQKPCEDGEYELEDGRKITIKGGKVDAIAEIETEEEVVETPENDAKMEEEKGKEKEKEEGKEEVKNENESSVEDRISALENQINQILEILQGMSSMQDVAMSKIKEIENSPAEQSVKVGKVLHSNTAFNSIKGEIEELKDLRKKYNLVNNGGYSFKATESKK